MEVLYNSDYLILRQSHYSLWFKRNETFEFKIETGIDFTKLSNLKCLGIAYTLIGRINDKLILTVRNQFVGQLPSEKGTDLNVYKIKKITILNLNLSFENQTDFNFESCPIHESNENSPVIPHSNSSFSINQTSTLKSFQKSVFVDSLNYFPNSQSLSSKTWNTIKSTSGKIINKSSSHHGHLSNIYDIRSKNERRLYEEIFKMFNETDSFYYCDNGDITNSIQRKEKSKDSNQYLPFWKRVDDRFFFNKYMLSFLIDDINLNKSQDLSSYNIWIMPILQGFIQMETCKIDDFENNEKEFKLFLISRRSRYRAGTRYKRRGVDENGKVANYVETEQILKFEDHIFSFVQVRGSIPIFWGQPGHAYRPSPVLEQTFKESLKAFQLHFEEEFFIYNKIIILNLIEQFGRESIIGDSYLKHVLEMDNENLSYISFDFHHHCRGMKFENVNILVENMKDKITDLLYFWKDNQGIMCKQIGVFRVNCVDCLDRTNLVQSALAKYVLSIQLNKLTLLAPDCQIPYTCRKIFQQLWANNGDAISRQYAGTSALKGDFTRTGERKFSGVMKDSYNSASRYYLNRFKDIYRQAAIDTLLGNTISDLDLNSSDLDHNNNDEDIEIYYERIKQIIEDCKMYCIAENEIILGSWPLINADNTYINSVTNEMDSVLILTKNSYYVIKYDETRDRITKCQLVLLEDIEKIELGPEPNMQLFSSIRSIKQSFCIRIHYLFGMNSGYFHMFRPINVRFFNNMPLPIRTLEEAIESLKSIVESFKVALSVKSINVPLFEGKLEKRKSNKPQLLTYNINKNRVNIGSSNTIKEKNYHLIENFKEKSSSLSIEYLPRNVSDGNLLRFKNASKNALNNVSSQFTRFKNKFTGSTRSNVHLPENILYEQNLDHIDYSKNNSCLSLTFNYNGLAASSEEDTSIVDDTKFNKINLKPELPEDYLVDSFNSVFYSETPLSSEFSSSSDLDDLNNLNMNENDFSNDVFLKLGKQKSSFFTNFKNINRYDFLDTDDTLLESCGILITSPPLKHNLMRDKKNAKNKIYSLCKKKNYSTSRLNIYNEVDDFVLDAIKKATLKQIYKKASSSVSIENIPKIQINNQNFLSTNKNWTNTFRSSEQLDNHEIEKTRKINYNSNSVSCAAIGSNSLSDFNCKDSKIQNMQYIYNNDLSEEINYLNEDRQQSFPSEKSIPSFCLPKSANSKYKMKNSFSETPLKLNTTNIDNEKIEIMNSIQEKNLTNKDFISNPLIKMSKGVQNLNLNKFNNLSFTKKHHQMSKDELEQLEELKKKSKSTIIRIPN